MSMKEIKRPNRPVWIFYIAAFLLLLLLNMLVIPSISSANIQQVDYGPFLNIIDQRAINTVQRGRAPSITRLPSLTTPSW